jgi:hypothetical protein
MILRSRGGCIVPVVPGHPLRRVYGHLRRIPEQLRQVVERIDLIQFAGVDQAHEEIAHTRSVHRLIEERILAMQNSLLQCSFDDVMPRAGLCRVGPIRPSIHRLPRMTDAA